MHQKERYQVLLKRSAECEVLAQTARDMSIRKKSAELAVEYKAIADRMKQIQMIEEVLHQPGF